jgi:hypothetical protein
MLITGNSWRGAWMEGNGDVVCKSRLTPKRWLCEQGQIYREPDEAESSGLLTWMRSCTGPFQGRVRNPNNALKCSKILQLICERKLLEVFPDLTAIPKVYVTFPITSCTAERNFSNPWIILKKQISINYVRGKTGLFLYSPYKKNVTSKPLSYEKAIKEYAAKKCLKKVLQWCVRHLVNTNIMPFFLILWCLWCQLF